MDLIAFVPNWIHMKIDITFDIQIMNAMMLPVMSTHEVQCSFQNK